eukprot:355816-Chlamydomonas_euryale.AAC.7
MHGHACVILLPTPIRWTLHMCARAHAQPSAALQAACAALCRCPGRMRSPPPPLGPHAQPSAAPLAACAVLGRPLAAAAAADCVRCCRRRRRRYHHDCLGMSMSDLAELLATDFVCTSCDAQAKAQLNGRAQI